MANEIYANQPSTTVSSGGTDAPASGTQEMWTVASSSSFPAASVPAAARRLSFMSRTLRRGYTAELIAVTNVSGTTWTVTRGAESTTPVEHVAGFTITAIVTAGALGALAVNPMTALGDLIYRWHQRHAVAAGRKHHRDKELPRADRQRVRVGSTRVGDDRRR